MREAVGPWTLCEGGAGAYRALLNRNGEIITHRVAFIEKTVSSTTKSWIL